MDNRDSRDLAIIIRPATAPDIHTKKIISSQNVLDEKLAGFDPTFASTLHHLLAASVVSAALWGIIVASLGN